MIIFKNGGFETNSNYPNSDWTGKAVYVLEDNSDFANKVMQYFPNYTIVEDGSGNIIDVIGLDIEQEDSVSQPTIEERIFAIEEAMLLIL